MSVNAVVEDSSLAVSAGPNCNIKIGMRSGSTVQVSHNGQRMMTISTVNGPSDLPSQRNFSAQLAPAPLPPAPVAVQPPVAVPLPVAQIILAPEPVAEQLQPPVAAPIPVAPNISPPNAAPPPPPRVIVQRVPSSESSARNWIKVALPTTAGVLVYSGLYTYGIDFPAPGTVATSLLAAAATTNMKGTAKVTNKVFTAVGQATAKTLQITGAAVSATGQALDWAGNGICGLGRGIKAIGNEIRQHPVSSMTAGLSVLTYTYLKSGS